MPEPVAEAPIRIGLPEPLGRRMRLGPFPSARHAVKFAAYAAVGGTVAAGLGAVWSLPFLAAGLACSTVVGETGPIDERAGRFLAYQWRRRRALRPEPPRAPPAEASVEVGAHRIAVLATGGVPVAFLPPDEARGLFEAFRALLRELDHGLFLQVALEPLAGRPFLPPTRRAEDAAPDRAASRGYAELVRLLCRRRYRRRVLLVVWERSGPGSTERLERAVGRLQTGLGTMGLAPIRLERATLTRALVELGWTAARSA